MNTYAPSPPHVHRPVETGATREHWDPDKVEDLINEVYRNGRTPELLCLGRREAAALKAYLERHFGDGEEIRLSGYVYAGLSIVTVAEESLISIEVYESGPFDPHKHAQHRIRKIRDGNNGC